MKLRDEVWGWDQGHLDRFATTDYDRSQSDDVGVDHYENAVVIMISFLVVSEIPLI